MPESRYLSSVQIVRTSEKSGYGWGTLTIDSLNKPNLSYDLEVGWTFETQTIVLHSKNSQSRFKVEVQYETSLQVQSPIPEDHSCDLIDWKHYNSKWYPLKEQSKDRFLIPLFMKKGSMPYPKVSIEEIYNEVRRREGLNFSKPIKKLTRPDQLPCRWFISMYTIRISVLEKGIWTIINEIELNPSLGC